MARSKISVSVDDSLIRWLDEFVGAGRFDSRSAAMDAAVEALQRAERERQLRDDIAQLDPEEEQEWAEWGLGDYAREVLGPADSEEAFLPQNSDSEKIAL